MASVNGTKLTIALHGITWALLAAVLALAVQIRGNDLSHIATQLAEVRQMVFDHIEK